MMKSDIRESRVPGESFEAQYRARRDPWNFACSPYEQHRYSVAIAMLPQPRYRRGFEPGCSIGELTVRLAARSRFSDGRRAFQPADRPADRRCA